MSAANPFLACETCGKKEGPDTHLLKCARCRHTVYCSTSCQKKDWKEHKKVCAPRRVLRKTMQGQNRARKDTTCGACGKDMAEEIRARGYSKEAAEGFIPLGCGHVAHKACLKKQSKTTCPTCGQMGDFGAVDFLPDIRGRWFDGGQSPKQLFEGAMGYIFQVKKKFDTGEEGSVQEELVFIKERTALVVDLPRHMWCLRVCMEEQARLAKLAMPLFTAGKPMTPEITERLTAQRVNITFLILAPFIAGSDRDVFAPYVMRWLRTLGL